MKVLVKLMTDILIAIIAKRMTLTSFLVQETGAKLTASRIKTANHTCKYFEPAVKSTLKRAVFFGLPIHSPLPAQKR
jgi:hypothetical protein